MVYFFPTQLFDMLGAQVKIKFKFTLPELRVEFSGLGIEVLPNWV